MSPAHPFDASIPVLTEVLHDEPPAHAAEAHAPPHDHDHATPHAVPPAAAAAHVADDGAHALDSAQLAALEQRLAESIFHKLQARVDFVLEQRIRDSMEEVLSHALQGLTSEIRHGLHDTLSTIVTRAVSQELLHLQAQKK